MRERIHIIEKLLPNPQEYRKQALASEFRSVDVGNGTFRGIATANEYVPWLIKNRFSDLAVTMTFLRKSSLGQVEPNFVHTDEEMGDWTGILYLNNPPAPGDGTCFWKHMDGAIESTPEGTYAKDWKYDRWITRRLVDAVFNRLLLFPARLFHSRAIYKNYGQGDDARLIQVLFGTGKLPEVA